MNTTGMPKGRILHVVNIYFVLPYFIGEQFRHFQAEGYEEYVICSPSPELAPYAQASGFYYKEVEISRKISIVKDLRAIYGTYRYIVRNHINVVNGHTPKGGFIAMAAAFVAHVPIRIYFRHGLVYETSTGIKRKVLLLIDRVASRMATKIVCVSASVAQKSIDDRLNAAKKQLLLHKGTCNGTNTTLFDAARLDQTKRANIRMELGLKPSDFVVGYVGRLVKDKGIAELVAAMEGIKEERVKLLLVGMFEERDALPKHVVDCIAEDKRILHVGYVPFSEVAYYYAQMNLFVLPSYREGFPTTVLEASCMGLPVVTTKATGCVDAIVPEHTGVYVEHSGEAIRDAIVYFLTHEAMGKRYGSNGHAFVMANFRQEQIWEEIEKMYIP